MPGTILSSRPRQRAPLQSLVPGERVIDGRVYYSAVWLTAPFEPEQRELLEMVADGVPPWIARRSQGVEVEAAIDISQRQIFYQLLEENISAAVIRFRAREDVVAA